MIASTPRLTSAQVEWIERTLTEFLQHSDWTRQLRRFMRTLTEHGRRQISSLVSHGANPFELVELFALITRHQQEVEDAREEAKTRNRFGPPHARRLARELADLANELRGLGRFASAVGIAGFATTLPAAMESEARALRRLAPLLKANSAPEPVHLLAAHVRDTTGRPHILELVEILNEQGIDITREALSERLARRRKVARVSSPQLQALIASRSLTVEVDGWVCDEYMHVRRVR